MAKWRSIPNTLLAKLKRDPSIKLINALKGEKYKTVEKDKLKDLLQTLYPNFKRVTDLNLVVLSLQLILWARCQLTANYSQAVKHFTSKDLGNMLKQENSLVSSLSAGRAPKNCGPLGLVDNPNFRGISKIFGYIFAENTEGPKTEYSADWLAFENYCKRLAKLTPWIINKKLVQESIQKCTGIKPTSTPETTTVPPSISYHRFDWFLNKLAFLCTPYQGPFIECDFPRLGAVQIKKFIQLHTDDGAATVKSLYEFLSGPKHSLNANFAFVCHEFSTNLVNLSRSSLPARKEFKPERFAQLAATIGYRLLFICKKTSMTNTRKSAAQYSIRELCPDHKLRKILELFPTITKIAKSTAPISPEERTSSRMYSDHPYREINDFLRGQPPKPGGYIAANELDQHVKNITSAISKRSFDTDQLLYRGLKAPTPETLMPMLFGKPDGETQNLSELICRTTPNGNLDIEQTSKNLKNKTITNKAFTSTSLSKEIAAHFYSLDPLSCSCITLMEITAPKGTCYTFLDDGTTVVEGENEVLLAPGTEMKINDVKILKQKQKNDSYYFKIKCTITNNPAKKETEDSLKP